MFILALWTRKLYPLASMDTETLCDNKAADSQRISFFRLTHSRDYLLQMKVIDGLFFLLVYINARVALIWNYTTKRNTYMAINNITEIRPGVRDQHGHTGDGFGGGGMDARLAKLEVLADHIQSDLKDVKQDMREIKKDAKEDFRVLFGSLILVALGLAGLMAKGFHWL